MRYSREHKLETHARIVKKASVRLREKGAHGIGVADLMKDAGLTHGGFYRHFGSREELVAEAVEHALHDGSQAVVAIANSTLDRPALLAVLVDGYLSAAHRDGLATSCAVTTLAGDVSRCNDRTRSAYTQQVDTYLKLLTQLVASDQQPSRRVKAIAALSALVGAVSLARAVNDEKLSQEILKSVADELKAQLG